MITLFSEGTPIQISLI